MSHGYEFYESSLSHLVDSLVQVPEVPWSQIQRILALCPRVDSSSCTVSLRQHIAVCAAADYFTRSNGQHAVNLKSYFVSLISSLPKITWNLSKNQIRMEEDFVAYLMTDKICRALLEVKVKDGDVLSTLTECFDTLLALVQDNVSYFLLHNCPWNLSYWNSISELIAFYCLQKITNLLSISYILLSLYTIYIYYIVF